MCVRVKRLSIFSAAGLGGMLLTGPGDTPTAGSPRSLTRTGAVFKLVPAGGLMSGARS